MLSIYLQRAGPIQALQKVAYFLLGIVKRSMAWQKRDNQA
jgi:hypothetical protein